MNVGKTLICALLIMAVCSPSAIAGGPVARSTTSYQKSTAAQAAAKKLNSGLVIVPFAVPVAVPVATVQQPSVLYSYRHYAPQNRAHATASSPAAATTPPATASEVLTHHCISCHRGETSQGSLTLFDASGAIVGKLPRQAILDAVEQGRMPLPATSERLAPHELDLLRAWARPPRDLVY